MVALTLKIIIAALILMFLDLLITSYFGGFVTLQGEEFTLLTLLIRLFEILAAFLVLIIHFFTHILQLDVAMQDIQLLIDGIFSVFLWVIGSLIDLLMHVVRIPFIFLTDLLSLDGIYINFGLEGAIEGAEEGEADTWAISLGSLLIDLRHLTIVVSVPKIHLDILGIFLEFENTIAFSFLGVEAQYIKVLNLNITEVLQSEGQELIKNYRYPSIHATRLNEFMSIFISLEDYAWTEPGVDITIPFIEVTIVKAEVYLQVPPFIEFPITFPLSANDPDISMQGLIQGIIDGLGIPTPVEWMESVYSSVIPAVGSPTTILTEIQNNIKVRKWRLTQMA